MSTYSIPGVRSAAAAPAAVEQDPVDSQAVALAQARSVGEVLAQSQVEDVLAELDRDLVGLVPVKTRIRDIAALLVIDKPAGQAVHGGSGISLGVIEQLRQETPTSSSGRSEPETGAKSPIGAHRKGKKKGPTAGPKDGAA